MSAIKERSILFSGPMVRAILEGRKTVTRRPVKGLQIPKEDPAMGETRQRWSAVGQRDRRYGFCVFGETEEACAMELGEFGACPYGRPGDRLWVRETWGIEMLAGYSEEGGYGSEYELRYRADESERGISVEAGEPDPWLHLYDSQRGEWRPSIHMPRAASRILLEITGVRVERLQDISEAQAIAEGCFFTDYGRKCGHGGNGWREVGSCPAPEQHHPQLDGWMWDKTTSHEQCLGTARWAFGNLWEKTGGDWDANPWVWVVEFKRIEQ